MGSETTQYIREQLYSEADLSSKPADAGKQCADTLQKNKRDENKNLSIKILHLTKLSFRNEAKYIF